MIKEFKVTIDIADEKGVVFIPDEADIFEAVENHLGYGFEVKIDEIAAAKPDATLTPQFEALFDSIVAKAKAKIFDSNSNRDGQA